MNKIIKWTIIFPLLVTISGAIIFLIFYSMGVFEWIHIIPIAAILGALDAFFYLKSPNNQFSEE